MAFNFQPINDKPCQECKCRSVIIDEKITEQGQYVYSENCARCFNLKYGVVKKAPQTFWESLCHQ